MRAKRLSAALTRNPGQTVAWVVFVILLATYWSTVAPSVSFWDCPEYVSAGYLLEVGHPPGNPVWMLCERMVTLLVPPQYAALAINLSSGLFTALAGYFLARTIYAAALLVLRRKQAARIRPETGAAWAALLGSLAFGWCDSVWYSAVEAEVYAMSIFMTSLCIWLMVKWAAAPRLEGIRLLVLLAYLFGLSLGVHQLNLLCIPALTMIWALKRGIRSALKLTVVFLISIAVVGIILAGIMPYTIIGAARFELWAVNGLHLPLLSGVAAFVALLGIVLIAALAVTSRQARRGGRIARRIYTPLWMLAMLLVGYSSYALIPIRGSVPSPANSAMPGNPFSFASYLAREQYGSKPLLYGPTPYSKPVIREEFDSSGKPVYRNYLIDYKDPIMVVDEDGTAYMERGRRSRNVKTPELNMWFPRITSSDPRDLASYEAWIGMDSASMTKVSVSEVMDTAGNFTGRIGADGKRHRQTGLRPTYMQNLSWFVSYQTGYMYWRYLLWNFVGRQNDRPAQGEVQHGNFITGIGAIDNAMLGADDRLPAVAGSENKGRNRYYGLPLILGIIGIFLLLRSGRSGRDVCLVTAVLFVMTGLAITVYLNQDPGEPRERDYSFLGSYLAYCIWIAFGSLAVARLCRSAWGFAIPLGIVLMMGCVNYDDHDRSGRHAARNFAVSVLESLEPDAVIFVNGDNYTFPLWYAQEVEGVRRDVRVVNLAYLNTTTYSANLLADWRDSRRLPTVLKRGDLVRDAFRRTKVDLSNRDTLPALEALRRLRRSEEGKFPSRYVSLRIGRDSTAVYDLRNLSTPGGTVDFGRLMILDIVSGSAEADSYRPVYWLWAIGADKRFGMTPYTSPWLFGRRYGIQNREQNDSLLYTAAMKARSPYSPGRKVYMDHTPSSMVGTERGALVYAGQRLLESGRVAEAVRVAEKADIMMGDAPDSYGAVVVEDSAFNVRRELSFLLSACADSIAARAVKADGRKAVYLRASVTELKARADYHDREYHRRKDAWTAYRQALPPRLRGKMSPVY